MCPALRKQPGHRSGRWYLPDERHSTYSVKLRRPMSGLFVKLDVEYASDDKMIEAGPMAELLYVRGLAFCKKNSASDGKISTAQLAVVAVGIPGAKKAAARLVEVEAWTPTDRGWIVTSWLKRNRSGADIQAQAEMASALGIQGNHERWHIGPDGKPSPKCSLCIGLHRQTRSGGRSGYPIGGSSPETEEEVEEEVEEESKVEEETEKESSSSVRYLRESDPTTDDDDFMKAIKIVVQHKATMSRPDNRFSWELTVVPNTINELGKVIHAELDAGRTPLHAAGVALGSQRKAELAAGRLA